MIFVSVNRSAALDFTTPLKSCCNCGAARDIQLVETQLRRTRFMLFGGTELTLTETFPYCPRCKSSAQRVRNGKMARALSFGVATLAIFTIICMRLSMKVDAFVPVVRNNPFAVSVALAAAGCIAWFRYRDSNAGGRSYYQPVRLADVTLDGDSIRRVSLAFFNQRYADGFIEANQARVRAGVLEVRKD